MMNIFPSVSLNEPSGEIREPVQSDETGGDELGGDAHGAGHVLRDAGHLLELRAMMTKSWRRSPRVSPDIFGSRAHVMRSSRFPGTRMMPSERTILPFTMLCVAGLVTSFLRSPLASSRLGCLLHRRA